jgi:hypothetical protein
MWLPARQDRYSVTANVSKSSRAGFRQLYKSRGIIDNSCCDFIALFVREQQYTKFPPNAQHIKFAACDFGDFQTSKDRNMFNKMLSVVEKKKKYQVRPHG